MNMVEFAENIYGQILAYALPIAFFFGMSNAIVNPFFSAAFGGKMRLGGDK